MTALDSSDKFPFSGRIQKAIVSMVIHDWKNFALYRETIKPEYFDNPVLENIVEIVYTFYKKYNRVPSKDELLEEVVQYLGKNKKEPEDEYIEVSDTIYSEITLPDFRFTKDKIIEFARDQAIKASMIESIKLLEQKNYEGIRKRMETALNVGRSSENLGTFYFDNLETRIERRQKGETRHGMAISTGLSKLDTALGGGIAPPELGVIMGPSKRGKTVFAVNIAVNATMPTRYRPQGCNVAHYVLESNEDRTQVLYDAKISGLSKDDVSNKHEEVRNAVEKFRKHENVGKLILKQFPADSCSAWDIESHIQNLKITRGVAIHLIIIDYLKLMRVADKSFRYSNDGGKYEALGQITKELLSIAQRYNIAIWVLHQTRRSSFHANRIDLDDSADSMEPIRDADLILTINQVKGSEGMMRIYIAGGREVADQKELDFYIDKATVRIRETHDAT